MNDARPLGVALTVEQPYAQLLITPSISDRNIPVKPTEVRSWCPPDNVYRKRIFIHAARTEPNPVVVEQYLRRIGNRVTYPRTGGVRLSSAGKLPLQAIIGSVIVADYYVEGGKCYWIMRNPIPLPTPVATPGHPGIWSIPSSVLREILKAG